MGREKRKADQGEKRRALVTNLSRDPYILKWASLEKHSLHGLCRTDRGTHVRTDKALQLGATDEETVTSAAIEISGRPDFMPHLEGIRASRGGMMTK